MLSLLGWSHSPGKLSAHQAQLGAVLTETWAHVGVGHHYMEDGHSWADLRHLKLSLSQNGPTPFHTGKPEPAMVGV